MEGFDAAVNGAVVSCAGGLGALAKFRTGGDRHHDAEVVRVAIGKNLKEMARALDAAERRGRADDFHELRKAVKAHAVHVDLLAAVWPRRGADYAKSLAKLGQSLGDLHDITMVRSQLPDNTDAEVQKAIDRLLKLMRRKEKKLRKRCVAEARRLLPDRPKKAANALAENWLQAAEARLAA
jgi:CHAD domain-containing protein